MNNLKENIVGYGTIITVWFALVGLSVLMIALASFKSGKPVFILAILISLIQGSLIFRIFITRGFLKFAGTEKILYNIFVALGIVVTSISFILLFI
ncbi:MAG: hypothetical protein GX452_11690 [Ignavibacteriales bacterium]|jgi:hypothetical protein|nr:hypothetical protein [Ignavibacteriaceae bacterium]NLH62054.1 hypothetical protein [Ignavibacteriales bacterium]HOJ17698.1 hypothetical protein [Ignavibacteriaceae bacterium]HPO55615.1 hypothetical protein [Ignavibacteriaceae bacterium]